MSDIKVSIVVTLYNLGQYLDECIESIGDFKSHKAEVIIVNDGSTDALTLEVLNKYRNVEGILVIDRENGGVAKARNTGIEQARGEVILSVDADNKISEDYYVKGLAILMENPKVGVVYSDVQYFGEESRERKLDDFIPEIFLAVNYIDNCALLRKSIWKEIGGYDSNMPNPGYEDWEMWISIFGKGFDIYHISETLYSYRVRPESMISSTNQTENRVSNFDYLVNKHGKLYSKYVQGILVHLTKNVSELENELTQSVEHGNQISEDRLKILDQLQHANQANFTLHQRINDFENSKLFKFKKQIQILITRFKSNSGQSKSNNILRKIIVAFGKKSRSVMKRLLALVFKHLYLFFEETKVVILEAGNASGINVASDPLTRLLFKTLPDENELFRQKKEIDQWETRPTLSVLMPVYNPPIEFFKRALDTILQQSYEYWELCLADDCSTDPAVKKVIEEYRKRDGRIKVVYRETNGHISAASNSAMEIAIGDFFVLMDQDDEIALDAFYWCVKTINEGHQVDMVYTDEDKIDEFGNHSEPHFKPDWSPDNLLSRNYLGHLTVFNADIFKEIGGWREGFEGSQDYDLVLRFSEKCRQIAHIPRVLYHWRIHSESAAGGEDAKPYAYTAAQKALTEALQRRGYEPNIGFLDGFRGYSIRLALKNQDAKVSIIIPTKDKADILSVCIDSIFEKSTWQNFEVIVIDNNSSEKETFDLLDKWKAAEPDRFMSVRTEEPFNFSFLMNLGNKNASGEFLVLLNNDTEVISPDWMEAMMEHAQRPEVGVVGVKLLYPNDTIQHAGVIIGLGGAAGHVFVGDNRNGPGYFNYVNLLNNYCAVTAACVMIRTELFNEVEGFNENFAVEYNDVDFCLKVWDKGYRNLYVPHCELYHHESISRGHPHMTKESFERHKAEIQKLKNRWGNYIDYDPCYNPNLSLGAHDFRMKS